MPNKSYTIFSEEVLLTKGANNGRFCFLYPTEERGPLGDFLYRDLFESNKMTYIVEGRTIYLQKVDGTERRLQCWVIPKRIVYMLEDGVYKPYILQSAADRELIHLRQATQVKVIAEDGTELTVVAKTLYLRTETASNDAQDGMIRFSVEEIPQTYPEDDEDMILFRSGDEETNIPKSEEDMAKMMATTYLLTYYRNAFHDMDMRLLEPYITPNCTFSSPWMVGSFTWEEYKYRWERKFAEIRLLEERESFAPVLCGHKNNLALRIKHQGAIMHITIEVENNMILSAYMSE